MLSIALRLWGAVRLQLFFSFLILSIICFAQPEPIDKIDISPSKPGYDPDNALLRQYILKVDSISHTNSQGSHFARIYTESMRNIGDQMTAMDSGAQNFIKKFEISFIGYFLEANNEFGTKGQLPAESVWNFYYSHPGAQPWQLMLIGVNAHVNGDIWKGLVKNFSVAEIMQYKKTLLSFQSSISKAFQPLFDDILMQSAYLRFINGFTNGSAKLYGEWLIYNWRLRQINLAILYFEDNEKFKKKLRAIDKKRQKIDKAIISKG
ncbi:MAG: DUF5995 family protein [Chitinophagales bacterium]